ncbi:MAG: hypothetical protein WBD79_17590, partial [Anaerolineae bacterium]
MKTNDHLHLNPAVRLLLAGLLITTLLVPLDPPAAIAEPAADSGWSTTTALPQTLSEGAAVSVGDWLYAIGGVKQGNLSVNTVYRARVRSDGTLENWMQTSGANVLPKTLKSHAAVAYYNRIYVLGGHSTATESSVYVANVNSDGSLAGWRATTPLPNARFGLAAVAARGVVYIIGGYGTGPLPGVWHAWVQADGTLGAWSQDASLQVALYRHSAVVYDNAIYVIGGRTANGVSRKVYRAVIQENRNLGAWTEVGSNLLPEPRAEHISLVDGSQLFVIGGTNGASAQATMLVYQFEANGSLTALPAGTPLPAPRLRAMGAANRNHNFYMAGGLSAPGAPPTATVYRTTINQPLAVDLLGQIGGASYAADVVGDRAYLGVGPRLVILDVSNPASPTLLGQSSVLPGIIYDLVVANNVAYVAYGDSGLQIIDVSNPANPVRRGGYDTPGYARGVAVAGSLAYVADYYSGLQIIDVSNPANPVRRGGYDTPGYAWGVTVADSLVYVADSYRGLQIIDVSNPANPV